MRILAIDPGPRESAYVFMSHGRDGRFELHDRGMEENAVIRTCVVEYEYDVLAIEMVESFGMAVGKEVFQTVFWVGRLCEAACNGAVGRFALVYRKDVKLNLCGNYRAKDANIRQALLDKLGPQGTKKAPGPTYGISKHLWSALAVGVTYAEIGARP